MPSCASLLRILRRRLVLGLIFALSLTYCAFSLLRNERKTLALDGDLDNMDTLMVNDNNDDLMSYDDALPELRASGKPQSWQAAVLDQGANDNALNADTVFDLNSNDSTIDSCRNSIQGKVLIVDERGIVCARREVLPNGCCSLESKDAAKVEDASPATKRERYSCKTCNAQGCCAIYEYCVSCCLHPGKQLKGKKVLSSLHKDHQKHQLKDEDVVRKRLRNLDRFQVCLAACRTSSASVRHENTYKDPHSKHCYTVQPPFVHQRHRRDLESVRSDLGSARADHKPEGGDPVIARVNYNAEGGDHGTAKANHNHEGGDLEYTGDDHGALNDVRDHKDKDHDLVKDDLALVNEDLDLVKDGLAVTKGDLASTKSDPVSLKNDLEPRNSDLVSSKNNLEPANGDLGQSKSDLESASAALDSSSNDLEPTGSDLGPSKIDLEPSTTDLESSKNDFGSMNADLSPSTGNLDSTNSDLGHLKNDLGSMNNNHHHSQNDFESMSNDPGHTSSDLDPSRSGHDALKSDLGIVMNNIGRVNDDLDRVNHENGWITKRNNNNNGGNSAVVVTSFSVIKLLTYLSHSFSLLPCITPKVSLIEIPRTTWLAIRLAL